MVCVGPTLVDERKRTRIRGHGVMPQCSDMKWKNCGQRSVRIEEVLKMLDPSRTRSGTLNEYLSELRSSDTRFLDPKKKFVN